MGGLASPNCSNGQMLKCYPSTHQPVVTKKFGEFTGLNGRAPPAFFGDSAQHKPLGEGGPQAHGQFELNGPRCTGREAWEGCASAVRWLPRGVVRWWGGDSVVKVVPTLAVAEYL